MTSKTITARVKADVRDAIRGMKSLANSVDRVDSRLEKAQKTMAAIGKAGAFGAARSAAR